MGLLLVLPALPRTPVFSVQTQGNLFPCHLSPQPGPLEAWSAGSHSVSYLFLPAGGLSSLHSGPVGVVACLPNPQSQEH